MKICNGCHLVIPEDQMVFASTRKGIKQQKPWCKPCDQKRFQKYNGTEKDKKCGSCGKEGRFGANINYCSTECRIKNKVESINENGCWLVKYPEKLIYYSYKPEKAMSLRKFTYEYYRNTKLPKTYGIITKCEDRCCINPDHLLLATATERSRIAAAIGTSKLRKQKDPIKKEILRLFLEEKISIKELAKKYNKSDDAMSTYIIQARKRFKNNYCVVCKNKTDKLYNAQKKYRIVCSEICGDIYRVGTSKINDLLEKFYLHKWPFNHLLNLYSNHKVLRRIIKNPNNYKNIDIKFELNDNELICLNCQKQHENIGSEFCSPLCMQEFLLK
jgi:hypothetical protein